MISMIARWRASRAPFPEAWRAILTAHVPFYPSLDAAASVALRAQAENLRPDEALHRRRGRWQIDDTVIVTISAVAARLVMNLPSEHYQRLTEIVVYESHYQHKATRCRGLWRGARLGHRRAVVRGRARRVEERRGRPQHRVARVRACARRPRRCLRRHADAEWPRRVRAVVASDERRVRPLRNKSERRAVLRRYGATNEAEFFAVATEAFFEKPRQMRNGTRALFVACGVLSRRSGGRPLTTLATASRTARVPLVNTKRQLAACLAFLCLGSASSLVAAPAAAPAPAAANAEDPQQIAEKYLAALADPKKQQGKEYLLGGVRSTPRQPRSWRRRSSRGRAAHRRGPSGGRPNGGRRARQGWALQLLGEGAALGGAATRAPSERRTSAQDGREDQAAAQRPDHQVPSVADVIRADKMLYWHPKNPARVILQRRRSRRRLQGRLRRVHRRVERLGQGQAAPMAAACRAYQDRRWRHRLEGVAGIGVGPRTVAFSAASDPRDEFPTLTPTCETATLSQKARR